MEAPSEPSCAALVERLDPDLFATALFAPEPGRGRLMTLYAFDIELSRAVQRTGRTDAGPMIALMRLQFWRDVVAGAFEGAEPKAHEVAGPLHGLLAGGRLARADAEAAVAAREAEIEGSVAEAFGLWAEGRFAAMVRLAAQALGAEAPGAEPAGQALARSFVLRTAPAMAEHGDCLIPGLTANDVASGRESAATAMAGLAREGLAALEKARGHRAGTPRGATPAFLPLWRAERELRRAAADPEGALAGPLPPAPGRRALALAWRSLSGRW